MDISKLCINEDVNSTCPTPTRPNENVNTQIIYQNNTQFAYQQSYPMQPGSYRNQQPQIIHYQEYSPILENNTNQYSPIIENNTNDRLSQLLEQCNMIHSRIGKYRVHPLTEMERSQIIDQVYHTTECMMTTIKELQSHNEPQENDINTMDDVSIASLNKATDDQTTDEYKIIRQARNLQDSNTRPKYRRRSKRSMIGQRCHACNTTETPEWRRGPDGARTLCNACGLHYSKLVRKGSMTVQAHNFSIESLPDFKNHTRIVQFASHNERIKDDDIDDDRS